MPLVNSMRPVEWATKRPALALFVLVATIYLLSSGVSRNGVGYSADGTFAFEMAKSVVVDPEHTYLHDYGHNFSRWGIGLPIALMPIVAIAEPLALLAPQRDRIPVDGYDILLVNYPPLAGTPQLNDTRVLDLGLEPGRYDRLILLSHTGLSVALPQGQEVATLIITTPSRREIARPIRVGIETAEWAYDRADVRQIIQHDQPAPAGRQIGNARAYYYQATWNFQEPVDLDSARLEYSAHSGNLYIDGAAARNAEGAWVDSPGVGRVWSERQNADFFRRIWFPLANALITAFGAVVVYRVVGRLGYRTNIALTTALIYGLSTMAWPYATFDFAEPLVAALIVTIVWLILIYDQTRLCRYLTLAGGVMLAAIATKYVTVIVFPILVVAIILSHKPETTWGRVGRRSLKPVLAFAAPTTTIVLVGLVGAAVVFDVHLLYVSQLFEGISRGWLGLPIELGLHGLVWSWGKGLLWYNPVLFLALPAIPWFIYRSGWRSFVFVAIPLAYLVLYSKKEVWYGGNGWGPRYLVPILPFLIVMAAPLFEWVIARGRHTIVRMAFASVLLASIAVQVLGVSKDFGTYLDMYQQQVAIQLPDSGTAYGGAAYQPWSSIQPEGDFAAVLYAHQFSPLLAHAWLLRADTVNLLAPDRTDVLEDALERSPWSRFGIDARPAHPENGLGLDFWSMTLTGFYLARPAVLALTGTVLLVLQLASLTALAAISKHFWHSGRRASRWPLSLLGIYGVLLLVFDTLHFML